MTRRSTGDETPQGLQAAARERILVLDGAMGTMIQQHKFSEADFRGERFADWPRDLRGNNDLLSLTQPEAIRAIHLAYLEAGADIVETNTFNSTRISQADYGMEELVSELNFASARLAREAADEAEQKDGMPPLRRRRAGADQSHRLDFARCQQSRLSRGELRRFARGLCRGRDRADRGRRRYSDRRDDLRHVERQGGAGRDRRRFRGARRAPAGHDLRHDHRSFRPHAVGPDADRLLVFAAPCQAPDDRPQLRARRARDARPSRRALADRGYARLRLSQCRPAQRVRPL